MLPILELGFIQVPSFFLVLSLLMGLAFFLTFYRARELNLNINFALDLSLVLVISALVGARLGHVVIEQFDYYLNSPIKIFYFWEGGFVFYGGLVLSFACGYLYLLLKRKKSFLAAHMQLYTPILSLSYALGRVGCFLEGCCYGKTSQLPWAVAGRHPTQLYSSFWELGVLVLILSFEKKNAESLKQQPEKLFFIWLFFHSLGRGLTEIFRDDFRGNLPLMSISSWLSLFWMGIAVVYFCKNFKKFGRLF